MSGINKSNQKGRVQMGKVTILKESCKTCGYCIKFCPKEVLAIGKEVNAKGYPYVVAEKPEACIGCAMCAQMCPEAAIEVWR